jgi:hypothetical protein
MKTDRTRGSRVLLAALLAALAASLFAAVGAAQTKKPISRKGLVDAVRINGLSTAELLQQIQARGVSFEMTPDAEAELRASGARPEVIEAARSNYRPTETETAATTTATTTAPARPANTPPRAGGGPPVPAGPPLSKNEIITMLQGGIASARVEQFVEARGVTFALTPETTGEIKAAGGDRSLIGAITEKTTAQVAGNSSDSPFGNNNGEAGRPTLKPRQPAPGGAPDYDDYIDRASSAYVAKDWNSAIAYAQQAAQLDPSQPRAYQLLGTMLLYVRHDLDGAEQAMRAAIERGGSAVFHVYHDHTGTFAQYCQGSFFISKTGVSFKADDGRDTFETETANIKEAKTNTFMGAQVGAFHIKPVQKINGRDNFNFAPGTANRAESALIVKLIQSH